MELQEDSETLSPAVSSITVVQDDTGSSQQPSEQNYRNISPLDRFRRTAKMLNSNQLCVDVQTQLPPSTSPSRSPARVKVPSPKYARWSEILRRVTNANFQCSVFCGGKKCKYETFRNWRENERDIPVIFSNWITSDILAMARPNNQLINEYNLIEYFNAANIHTIINLQQTGEHSSCGPPLHESGFAYDPRRFMDNQIYFYNFSWKDYSVVSEAALLDMVKVVAFALSQGKVAVHCHAGLGRTGVLICAYLIFTYRCQAHSAIKFVRSKRPNSVQSRSQIASLIKFGSYLTPCFIVYKSVSSKTFIVNLGQYLARQRCLLHGEELRNLRNIPKILFIICEKIIEIAGKESVLRSRSTVSAFLTPTQAEVSTASEENFVRKFLSVRLTSGSVEPLVANELLSDELLTDSMWEELSQTSHSAFSDVEEYEEDSFLINSISTNEDIDFNNGPVQQTLYDDDEDVKILSSETLQKHRSSFEILKRSISTSNENLVSVDTIVRMLTVDYLENTDQQFKDSLENFQKTINTKPIGWEKLCEENDLEMLVALFWSWFDNLDIPILTEDLIQLICDSRDFAQTFFKIDVESRYTIEYLIRFVIRLTRNESNQLLLLNRLMAFLAMKRVPFESETIRQEKDGWPIIKGRNREGLERYFQQMIDIINQISSPL